MMVDLATDLMNVLDVAIVRPRLASIDREDGEVIVGNHDDGDDIDVDDDGDDDFDNVDDDNYNDDDKDSKAGYAT